MNQCYKFHSIIPKDDEDRIKFKEIFQQMEENNDFNPNQLGLDLRQSRGIGAVLGMGIGDALGSCT
jgi:hypothetical protein